MLHYVCADLLRFDRFKYRVAALRLHIWVVVRRTSVNASVLDVG